MVSGGARGALLWAARASSSIGRHALSAAISLGRSPTSRERPACAVMAAKSQFYEIAAAEPRRTCACSTAVSTRWWSTACQSARACRHTMLCCNASLHDIAACFDRRSQLRRYRETILLLWDGRTSVRDHTCAKMIDVMGVPDVERGPDPSSEELLALLEALEQSGQAGSVPDDLKVRRRQPGKQRVGLACGWRPLLNLQRPQELMANVKRSKGQGAEDHEFEEIVPTPRWVRQGLLGILHGGRCAALRASWLPPPPPLLLHQKPIAARRHALHLACPQLRDQD